MDIELTDVSQMLVSLTGQLRLIVRISGFGRQS